MSTVKAKNIKVPNSAGTAEATLSFDGVDIVSDKPIAAPAAVSGNDLVNFSQVIGVGQTWQDVTASRALGVTYTNTTGKPIHVIAGIFSTNVGTQSATVNGVSSYGASCVASGVGYSSFIVPNLATYSVTMDGVGTKSVNKWVELR